MYRGPPPLGKIDFSWGERVLLFTGYALGDWIQARSAEVLLARELIHRLIAWKCEQWKTIPTSPFVNLFYKKETKKKREDVVHFSLLIAYIEINNSW